MKKLFFVFIMWAYLGGVGFAGPSYDMATGVLTLPTLEINGQIAFTNVSILFRADGTCSVLAFNAPPAQTFPYTTQILLTGAGPGVGDVITFSDNSMWIVKGSTMLPIYLQPKLETVTIYHGSDSLAPPLYGAKTDYWMLIGNNTTPFFIEPL